jgi:hypothetical protein
MRSTLPLPIAPGFVVLALGSASRPGFQQSPTEPSRGEDRERETPPRRDGRDRT